VRRTITPQRAFGLAIRSYREAKSLSQDSLAAISGLNRAYLGSVERGERNISLQNICALADALDVPTSTLFEKVEDLCARGDQA
jgi:transcriptional regulator with XRE-family HTH domain